jgi:hypothetical protein
MRVAIVGSRTFTNYDLLCETLASENITHIISGGAVGADQLAEKYAADNNIPITIYKAEWALYGKSAGFKRNITIVDASDKIIAFWDGKSKGTEHTITNAKSKGKIVKIVFINDSP